VARVHFEYAFLKIDVFFRSHFYQILGRRCVVKAIFKKQLLLRRAESKSGADSCVINTQKWLWSRNEKI
jgi:hypothetical protein